MTNEIENFMKAYGVPIHPCHECICGEVAECKIVCAFDNFDTCDRGMRITPSRILEMMRFLLQKGSFQLDQLLADEYEIYYSTDGAKSEFVNRGSTIDLCVLNLLTSLRPELTDDEVEKVRRCFL